MKKYAFFLGLALAAFIAPNSAKAVGDSCGQGNSDTVVDDLTVSTGVQTCVTDAVGVKYTFNAMGVCKGFPNVAGGLDNCYAVFNRPVEIDLISGNGSTGLEAIVPPVDDYDYFFAIADKSFEIRGRMDFGSNQYLGVDSDGDAVLADYCKPSGSVSTSVINSIPETITLSSAATLLAMFDSFPLECGTGSASDGTATITIDNVGFSDFSAELNINGYDWNTGILEASPINVVLLDAGGNVAGSSDAVEDVLFIKEAPSDVTVGETDTVVDIEFSSHEALQVYYVCDGDLTQANLALAGITISADPTNGCALVGISIGEGGLAPSFDIRSPTP